MGVDFNVFFDFSYGAEGFSRWRRKESFGMEVLFGPASCRALVVYR